MATLDEIADATRLEPEPLGSGPHGEKARRTHGRAWRPAPTTGHLDEPGWRPDLGWDSRFDSIEWKKSELIHGTP